MTKQKRIKKVYEKIDGLGPQDKARIIKALRQVWSWSHARRLVVKRCMLPNGFSRCEKCKQRCPRVSVDHIKAIGAFDQGYIERLFTRSVNLQGLCEKCHRAKTKKDLKAIREAEYQF